MIQIEFKNRDTDSALKKQAEAGFEALLGRSDLGFLELPKRIALWEASQQKAEDIRKDFGTTCFMGIGGSALGARTLQDAFAPFGGAHKVLFFDNIDAFYFWRKMDEIKDLERTHWVFVSKSGSTMETLAMADFVAQYLKQKGLRLEEKSTVISETRDNLLTEWAKSHDIDILEIPVDVGGRFSVLTPVGLLPAALMDLQLSELQEGAMWALEQKDLIAELAAQTVASWQRDEWITLYWMYCDSLKTYGAWLQQLWAESLAKQTTRNGEPAPRVSSPFPCVGATDQHSILQQVAEGAKDKFVMFFRVDESESYGPALESSLFPKGPQFSGHNMGEIFAAEAKATIQALDQYDISCLSLRLKSVSPAAMGALFMLPELLIGCLGEMLNINAFDQPGVELGKKLAKEILANKVVR